jgi:hypothetical protein
MLARKRGWQAPRRLCSPCSRSDLRCGSLQPPTPTRGYCCTFTWQKARSIEVATEPFHRATARARQCSFAPLSVALYDAGRSPLDERHAVLMPVKTGTRCSRGAKTSFDARTIGTRVEHML